MAERRVQPFAHVDAPLAPLYRRVMRVFDSSKRRFVVHLRPEDVVDALAADGGQRVALDAVQNALDSLHEWGNLRADPDASRVTSVEDFYRARYLYQFTREGEAAERALELYEQQIARRGELQAVALEDIRIRLRSLLELARDADPDPAVVHSVLLELTGRLDSLAANASVFMGGLQRTIELRDIDEEAFLAYKDHLIAYLERFVADLVVKAHDIAGTLEAIDDVAAERLLRLAAEREAGDAAPGEDGADPVEARLTDWRRRWSGLASWFSGDRSRPSQAALLRQRTRKAIPDLLTTISILAERRSGRSDRSADLRELARWFAQAPTDADAHRLWRAAFGLSTARHLTGPVADPGAPAAARWRDTVPVEIAPRLRETGHYQRRGKPARVADRSSARAHLAALVAAERAQSEAARARLATGRPILLSELGELDQQEFALFLRLLGEALAAGPAVPGGGITTVTSDGSMEITLTPVPGGGTVTVRTIDGVLHGPEHELTIVDRSVSGRLVSSSPAQP